MKNLLNSRKRFTLKYNKCKRVYCTCSSLKMMKLVNERCALKQFNVESTPSKRPTLNKRALKLSLRLVLFLKTNCSWSSNANRTSSLDWSDILKIKQRQTKDSRASFDMHNTLLYKSTYELCIREAAAWLRIHSVDIMQSVHGIKHKLDRQDQQNHS